MIMGIQVSFKDIDSGELLLSNMPCDWKFEKGQVIKGFWGCNSEVRDVELTMSKQWPAAGDDPFVVHQMVYVKRTPLFN